MLLTVARDFMRNMAQPFDQVIFQHCWLSNGTRLA